MHLGKFGVMAMAFAEVFRGKRVLVTGHTGFKGAWLCEWLLMLGAEVSGFALPCPTEPALFDQLGLAGRIRHRLGDIRDPVLVQHTVQECQPDYVFHLAAQPLVRLSYVQPVDTYATNVMGTIHILEALRRLDRACAAVLITTDKCYENNGSAHHYRESDPLGGFDPYSSSKAACEIAIASWRRSFFKDHPVKIASGRAGNVVGGGDWALDRIVPDCIRPLQKGEPIAVRNPRATRPWQHVLEPLSGYLWLASCLSNTKLQPPGTDLTSAFNFGPTPDATRTVAELVQEMLKHWPGRWEGLHDAAAVHEANLLSLSVEKARQMLHWEPVWNYPLTIEHTVAWYRQHLAGTDAATLTRTQIKEYEAAARRLNLPWSK